MGYVILGASAAGLGAAAAIRKREPAASITLISDEKPYFRPMIPLLVSGEKIFEEIGLPDDFSTTGAEFIHSMAESVNPDAHTVRLVGGSSLSYSRLLIATGARPRFPNVFGLKGNGVYSFRSSEAAGRIRKHAINARRAVIIGGGFAGIKAAEALTKAGLSVTILESASDILHPRLDKAGVGIIRAALEAKGVHIRTSDTALEILRENDRVVGVTTESGAFIPADFVVVAVGTIPNVDFLAGSGVHVDVGVRVGDTLSTNIDGIYAAGDAAVHSDIITGHKTLSGLWSNAVEMGHIAGANMTGDKLKFPGLLTVKNATEIAGVPVVSVGSVADGRYQTFTGGDRLHRMLAFDGDTIVGAVFMGELRGAGLYTTLIKNRTHLTPAQKARAIDDRLGYADFSGNG